MKATSERGIEQAREREPFKPTIKLGRQYTNVANEILGSTLAVIEARNHVAATSKDEERKTKETNSQ